MNIKYVCILPFVFTTAFSATTNKAIIDFRSGDFSITSEWLSMEASDEFFIALYEKDAIKVITTKDITDENVVAKMKQDVDSYRKTFGDKAYVVYAKAGKRTSIAVFKVIHNQVVAMVFKNNKLFAELRIPEQVFLDACKTDANQL